MHSASLPVQHHLSSHVTARKGRGTWFNLSSCSLAQLGNISGNLTKATAQRHRWKLGDWKSSKSKCLCLHLKIKAHMDALMLWSELIPISLL